MPVIELTSSYKDHFFNFARKFEYKSISFISRMNHKGQLFVPPSKTAKIFCEVSNSIPGCILNAIMITSSGIVMPLFSDTPPSKQVITTMTEMIINYKSKIFCILGIAKDTDCIKQTMSYTSYSTINYLLLKKDTMAHFYIEKTALVVKKAKNRDIISLFPLEKEYLLEEVFEGKSELNHQAVLLNLKKTCSNQNVYFGSFDKKIIAKVNTNGKGFGYNQIGGVFTKKEYRNQGISTYLMKFLLNDIHMSGKNAVLYVKIENKPALALYKKLGFQIVNNYSAHYLNI